MPTVHPRSAADHVHDYGTAQDVIRNAEARGPKSVYWDGEGQSTSGSRHFTGTDNIQEALALASEGWQKGLEQINATLDKIQAPAPLDGYGIVFDCAGDEPDVGRFLDGEPENMIQYTPQAELKAVSLELSWVYSACTEEEHVRNQGAALACIVDQLERTGRRCEIRLTIGEKMGQKLFAWTFLLKRAQDPMSLETLAFWLMHRSAFRRIGFAAMETNDFGHNLQRNNYGSPCTVQMDADAVCIPHLSYKELEHYTTPQKAMTYIAQLAREAGIDIEETEYV